MTAIFESIGQALDVCFLINSCEPTDKNSERLALIRILEQQPTLTKQQKCWLEQLIGQRSESVHFDDLIALEIRAQAAIVIDAVRNHLHPAESAAVTGCYTRRLIEKSGAVQYLSEYIKPGLSGRERLIADYAVLRALPHKNGSNHKQHAQEHVMAKLSLTPKQAGAHIREAKKRVIPLRLRGEANLDERFKRDGLILCEANAYV